MKFTCQNSPLPNPHANISIFADLSQYTMLARKKLVSLTKLLCNKKITYSWGFPIKLMITRDNCTYSITLVKVSERSEVLKLAKQWDLLPADAEAIPSGPSPSCVVSDWKAVNVKLLIF